MPKQHLAKDKTSTPSLNHPPYLEMICEAILNLKNRKGSSQPAIVKFIHHKYESALPQNFNKFVSIQLKKLVQSEKLFKVKNSYKINSTEKLHEKPVKEKLSKEEEKAEERVSEVESEGETSDEIPDILKNVKKMKRLSQVKTPYWLKKKDKHI